MSTNDLLIHPDRWLVCARAVVFDGIREVWAAESDPVSLTTLRLRSGQVELVDVAGAADRVRQIVANGCGTLHLVVERMGAAELELYEALRKIDAEMLIYVWREEPATVMQSIGSPEAAVSAAWSAAREMPTVLKVAGEWPPGYVDAYRQALRHWAQLLREEDPQTMTEYFDPEEHVNSHAEVDDALGAAAVTVLATAPETEFATPSQPAAPGWFVVLAGAWHWVDATGNRVRLSVGQAARHVADWVAGPGPALGSRLSSDRRASEPSERRGAQGDGSAALALKAGFEPNWAVEVSITAESLSTDHSDVWRIRIALTGTAPDAAAVELLRENPPARPQSMGLLTLKGGAAAEFRVAPDARYAVAFSWRDAGNERLVRRLALPVRR